MANFCRSPVAMYLMRKRFPQHQIISAGIHPILEPNMDRRSESFLQLNGFKDTQHMPRKISSNLISASNIVFALDPIILMKLNELFPKFKHKFYVLNHQMPKNSLSDPYKMNEENYNEIMKRIDVVINSINL